MSQADMLNLLAYKIAEYMAQREGHIHHEEINKSTVGTMEEDGSRLLLRVMSMEKDTLHDTHNKSGVEANDPRLEQTRQLVTSGDAYRAFINRYS